MFLYHLLSGIGEGTTKIYLEFYNLHNFKIGWISSIKVKFSLIGKKKKKNSHACHIEAQPRVQASSVMSKNLNSVECIYILFFYSLA